MNGIIRQEWQINKYNWMSLAGVLCYVLAAQEQHMLTAPVWVVWALIGAGLLESTLRCVTGLYFAGRSSGNWGTMYKCAEILLVTAAIAVTGGIRSEIWLLYFMLMIYHSLYAPARNKRLLDLYMMLLYLLATLPCQLLIAHPMPEPMFLLLLSTRLFFLILVSALARRVSANAHARDLELIALREQMAVGEERARIAREIHDGLGHAMVSIILRLELCLRLVSKNPLEAEALLREEIPALRAAWNEGRNMAFHLRPWQADETAELLSATLRRHCRQFAERTGMSVDVEFTGPEHALKPDVAFGLLRIIQEALTNAAKHAQGTAVTVALRYGPLHALSCSISDNGKGFQKESIQDNGYSTGIGLHSMRERAEKFGGNLTISSIPDRGTTVTVDLPR